MAGEEGPIFLGVFAEDVYVRLLNELDSNIKLSWEQITGESEEPGAATSLGKAYYFGDPSDPHADDGNKIDWFVERDIAALGFCSSSGTCSDQRLTIPAGTIRLPAATRVRIKNPDLSWWGLPFSPTGATPRAILEVAYKNESLREFIRELDDWARAGMHAVGIKIWTRHAVSDSTSQRLQTSILAVAQEAGQHGKRVWRFGAEAQAAKIELGPVTEEADHCVDLHARWFGLPYKAVDTEAKVAFSLETLARQFATPSQDQMEGLRHTIQSHQLDLASIGHCPRLSEANRDVLCRARAQSIAELQEVLKYLSQQRA